MATETGTEAVDGFGQVNRTVGTVFRYVLLVATLFGIVMLGALLLFVANDALQPFTADPGWHLTFFITLVLPTGAAGVYLYRKEPTTVRLGGTAVGVSVVTLMFSGGVAMIFVDIIAPIVWFAYVSAVAVPTVVVLWIQRLDDRPSFLTRFAGTILLYYTSLLGLPGPIGGVLDSPQVVPSLPALIQSLPVYPVDWMLMTGSLGAAVAVFVGGYAVRIRGKRAGLIAAGTVLSTCSVAGVAGPLVGIGSVPATVLASIAVVPTCTYIAGAAVTRSRERIGLVIPALVIGGTLLGATIVDILGFAGPQSWVDWQFLTSPHSRTAVNAGLYPAIGGSILLMTAVAVLSFPLGVGAAVYLEEYAPNNRFTRFIDINIANLAGVPSVVYGLLGLGVFVTYLGRPTGTVLIGGATLALLILPIVIISSREAIRSVPDEMRQASYGMGATRWQTVRRVVLPRAFPGILTGTILALGRAIGETAPLIMIGAPSVLFSLPTGLSSKVSAMPLQVFAWASLFASEDFYTKAVPAGVVVLISVLLAMNSVAIVLRNKYQSEQQ